MAMPSRKRLILWSFLAFLIVFFGGIILYLSPLLFGQTTYDAQGNPIRTVSLFPFGDGGGLDSSPIDVIVEQPTAGPVDNNPNIRGNNAERQDQFRLIDEGPVIGAYMFNAPRHSGIVGKPTATTTDADIENIFRYVELGTGHIFEGSTNNGEIARISNTTIPRINEAQFVNKDRVIMRYADTTDRIKTFSAELVRNFADTSGTPFKLQGVFLLDNIKDIDISREGKLLQVQSKLEGLDRSAIVVSDELGGEPVQVFASPVTEWLVSWNNSRQTALVQNRPSYNSVSTAYTLDAETGAFAPYIPGRKGLSVLPTNDLSSALLSVNENGPTKLYIWKRDDNQYIDLGISTFSEKCVHAPARNKFYCAVPVETIAAAEPDLWYQGVSSYSDQLWEIDAQTGRGELIALPIQYTSAPLDMVNMQISSDEQFLYFMDKRERSLWSYQIDYEQVTAGQTPTSQTAVEVNATTSTTTDTELNTETFFE